MDTVHGTVEHMMVFRCFVCWSFYTYMSKLLASIFLITHVNELSQIQLFTTESIVDTYPIAQIIVFYFPTCFFLIILFLLTRYLIHVYVTMRPQRTIHFIIEMWNKITDHSVAIGWEKKIRNGQPINGQLPLTWPQYKYRRKRKRRNVYAKIAEMYVCMVVLVCSMLTEIICCDIP